MPDLSIAENLVIGFHADSSFTHRWILPFKNKWFLRRDVIKGYAQKLANEYGVKAPDVDLPAGTLSGGNMQRLILARELSFNPALLLADKPTSGLDVGSQEYIRRRLVGLIDRGNAVLLVSEDLDEVLKLSGRIAVIYEGEIVGLVSADKATKEDIGLMMVGGR